MLLDSACGIFNTIPISRAENYCLQRAGGKCKEKISIVTSVFNTNPIFLMDMVRSFYRAAQYYPNCELILSDDGSTSYETLQVLEKLNSKEEGRKVRLSKTESM